MKKFISLFLIFSLMSISCITTTTQRQKRFESSKERKHGARLIITRKNGRQIEGELITVKKDSLLLLSITGRDVSVDVADIKVIRVVKKSAALTGQEKVSLYGLFIGAGLGVAALVSAFSRSEEKDAGLVDVISGTALSVGIGGIVGYLIGGIIGGIAGTSSGKEVTIQIEGMSDSEVSEAMDKLHKKARIRDSR